MIRKVISPLVYWFPEPTIFHARGIQPFPLFKINEVINKNIEKYNSKAIKKYDKVKIISTPTRALKGPVTLCQR